MKKYFITSILIMILELSKAQVSFYLSPDLYTKMSLNSDNPSLFDNWSTVSPQVSNNLFSYENSNYSLYRPFRIGISAGVELGNKNEVVIGFHGDGVSSSSELIFFSYQPYIDAYTVGVISSKSIAPQSRGFIVYKHYINHMKNKTTFGFLSSIGLAYRYGKPFENVGSFTTSGRMTKEGILYEETSIGYTNSISKAFLLGIGICSDIYIKQKYFCSLSFQYSHTKKSLYFEERRMRIINTVTNQSDLYIFRTMNRASGIYLTLSRKIQVYPRKKKLKESS